MIIRIIIVVITIIILKWNCKLESITNCLKALFFANVYKKNMFFLQRLDKVFSNKQILVNYNVTILPVYILLWLFTSLQNSMQCNLPQEQPWKTETKQIY